MIQEFVERWNKYKGNLEKFFKTTRQEEYSEYKDIVEALFKEVINEEDTRCYEFDLDKITIIDDENYQGMQIFIIPLNIYQPDAEDYVVTDTYYGSCSGCDTLLGISKYNDGLPNEEQVKEYMTLSLHLLQKCRWLNESEEGDE